MDQSEVADVTAVRDLISPSGSFSKGEATKFGTAPSNENRKHTSECQLFVASPVEKLAEGLMRSLSTSPMHHRDFPSSPAISSSLTPGMRISKTSVTVV